jgi:RelA/SpoT family protein
VITVAAETFHAADLECDMAEWVRRRFTNGEIDRAGRVLAEWWGGLPTTRLENQSQEQQDKIADAWHVANNWRACHAYPLNAFQVNLRLRARRVEKGALIAQRLKRMSSMLNKLERQANMSLSRMHDLGGCRAIMSDTDAVHRVVELYCGSDPQFPIFESHMRVYDYIRSPKPDGYRGIHLVGKFFARTEERQHWNNQRIEIQVRTDLQHAFATAVETVTTFTSQPLKFGGGQDQWKRFFSLMGSAIALREGQPPVPSTPTDEKELARELKDYADSLKVRKRLTTWTKALTAIPRRHIKGAKWLLLVLDVKANTISVVGFADRAKADVAVSRIEQRRQGSKLDAVLVWVNSARHLRQAYPNYYADTKEFLKALNEALRPTL